MAMMMMMQQREKAKGVNRGSNYLMVGWSRPRGKLVKGVRRGPARHEAGMAKRRGAGQKRDTEIGWVMKEEAWKHSTKPPSDKAVQKHRDSRPGKTEYMVVSVVVVGRLLQTISSGAGESNKFSPGGHISNKVPLEGQVLTGRLYRCNYFITH